MARWDIFQRETRRNLEVPSQPQDKQQGQTSDAPSAGRRPSENLTTSEPENPQRSRAHAVRQSFDRPGRNVERPERYVLRPREIRAMTDIGTFRTLDVQDLACFAYGGDTRAMNFDLGELRTRGLVQEKVVLRAHRAPRRVIALTRKGHGILRKASGLPRGQVL